MTLIYSSKIAGPSGRWNQLLTADAGTSLFDIWKNNSSSIRWDYKSNIYCKFVFHNVLFHILMSRKYKFYEKTDLYFDTYTVINWIDVFTRNVFKDVLLDSWNYCVKNKGLKIHAWCIMTNHVHMIISSEKDELSSIKREMKSFNSTSLKKMITEYPVERRKKWMLKLMTEAGTKNKSNNNFQLWQQHNHPILLDSNFLLDQKLDYIHNNPVKAGFVEEPEDFLYSSARDYAGIKGLVDIEFIE